MRAIATSRLAQSSQPQTSAAHRQSATAADTPRRQLPADAGSQRRLTVQDAEALAMKNNPQISVYRLLSLASKQVTREQRAATTRTSTAA